MDRINLAYVRDRLRAIVNAVMDLFGFIKYVKFLD